MVSTLGRFAGNTPTGVGKTLLGPLALVLRGKHPHRCGEDRVACDDLCEQQETPPPVWGRRLLGEVHGRYDGNTPTGVGKTETNSRYY